MWVSSLIHDTGTVVARMSGRRVLGATTASFWVCETGEERYLDSSGIMASTVAPYDIAAKSGTTAILETAHGLPHPYKRNNVNMESISFLKTGITIFGLLDVRESGARWSPRRQLRVMQGMLVHEEEQEQESR